MRTGVLKPQAYGPDPAWGASRSSHRAVNLVGLLLLPYCQISKAHAYRSGLYKGIGPCSHAAGSSQCLIQQHRTGQAGGPVHLYGNGWVRPFSCGCISPRWGQHRDLDQAHKWDLSSRPTWHYSSSLLGKKFGHHKPRSTTFKTHRPKQPSSSWTQARGLGGVSAVVEGCTMG